MLDWGDDMIAVWSLEEGGNSFRDIRAGTCGAACRLTPNGTVDNETGSRVRERVSMVNIDGANDQSTLACAVASTCSDLRPTGSVSFGLWAGLDVPGGTQRMIEAINGDGGYRLSLRSNGDMWCRGRGATTGVNTARVPSAPFTVTPTFVACRASSGVTRRDIVDAWFGMVRGSVTPTMRGDDVGSTGQPEFYLSEDSGSDWKGVLDEAWVYHGDLDYDSLCRICRCGTEGLGTGTPIVPCSCNGVNNALFDEIGNSAECNNCIMGEDVGGLMAADGSLTNPMSCNADAPRDCPTTGLCNIAGQ